MICILFVGRRSMHIFSRTIVVLQPVTCNGLGDASSCGRLTIISGTQKCRSEAHTGHTGTSLGHRGRRGA